MIHIPAVVSFKAQIQINLLLAEMLLQHVQWVLLSSSTISYIAKWFTIYFNRNISAFSSQLYSSGDLENGWTWSLMTRYQQSMADKSLFTAKTQLNSGLLCWKKLMLSTENL